MNHIWGFRRYTFVCSVCGAAVHSAIPTDAFLCMVCDWYVRLETNKPPPVKPDSAASGGG